jgi:two-component system, OmpR family, sensor kinase
MTLRVRLLAAFAYVLLLAIVALEVPLALNLSRRVDAEIKSEASSGAQLVADSAAGRLDRERELQQLLRTAARDLGGRVIVTDGAGRLVADSAGTGLRRAAYGSRPEIAAALSGHTAQGTRHSDSLGEDLLFTTVPLVRDGRAVGAVRVTQSVAEVQDEVRNDIVALVAIGGAVLVLGLGVAWILAGSIARPLRGLAGTARRIAAGDLDERAAEEGSKEQQEVAGAFNDMTARLAHAVVSQRDFVANASHQLRTPLTGLQLRLEAAALKSRDPEVGRELAAAERETKRLASLLNGLLALARERTRPAPAAPLPIGPELAAAVERWEGPAAVKDQRLAVQHDPAVTVRAAHEDLAIVIDNLIENAIEYSPAGSQIDVEAQMDRGDACIVVGDRGPGLPPGEEQRVFERFFRGRAAGSSHASGSGLGLAIVRALAERWGGTASIANRAQGGARAEVRLPAAPADTSLPSPDLELDEALPGRG